MMKGLKISKEVTEAHQARQEKAQLVKHLVYLRNRSNLTQAQLAKKIGCTQSRISKIENSDDENLSIGDLKAYLFALKADLRLNILTTQLKATSEIKYHALQIKKHLDELAELANKDDGICEGIEDFFIEAGYNLTKFIQRGISKLPKKKITKKRSIENVPHIDFVSVSEVSSAANGQLK